MRLLLINLFYLNISPFLFLFHFLFCFLFLFIFLSFYIFITLFSVETILCLLNYLFFLFRRLHDINGYHCNGRQGTRLPRISQTAEHASHKQFAVVDRCRNYGPDRCRLVAHLVHYFGSIHPHCFCHLVPGISDSEGNRTAQFSCIIALLQIGPTGCDIAGDRIHRQKDECKEKMANMDVFI